METPKTSYFNNKDERCTTWHNLIINNMATATRPLVVSEVLWFINSKFSKIPKNELNSVLNAFYTADELTAAKILLFEFTKAIKADYLPVFTERKGANKVRATIDDILNLFSLLDINKAELPCNVVLDIRRVPTADLKMDIDVSVADRHGQRTTSTGVLSHVCRRSCFCRSCCSSTANGRDFYTCWEY